MPTESTGRPTAPFVVIDIAARVGRHAASVQG
jgi:hypothetical protein